MMQRILWFVLIVQSLEYRVLKARSDRAEISFKVIPRQVQQSFERSDSPVNTSFKPIVWKPLKELAVSARSASAGVTLLSLPSSTRPVDVVVPSNVKRRKVGRVNGYAMCRIESPSVLLMRQPPPFVIAPRGISDNYDHVSLNSSTVTPSQIRATLTSAPNFAPEFSFIFHPSFVGTYLLTWLLIRRTFLARSGERTTDG